MKNILLITAALIAAPIILAACGSKKNTEEYVNAENFVMHTAEVYPEVEMANADAQTVAVQQKKFTYALNGTSIELLIDNIKVKSFDFYYTPDTNSIVIADFNCDGYDDIFIPYESPTDYGYYYCYIPEKNDFKENEELNTVGRIMTVSDDGILTEDRSDDLTRRKIDYQWFNGKLKAVKKTETYKSSEDGKIYTDVYNYDEKGTEYFSETIEGE